ncbi:MAG: hypothetical protein IKZ98_06880 [Clostridia bacterium]|nr:hypothetical protein [Clostridia bacterium]
MKSFCQKGMRHGKEMEDPVNHTVIKHVEFPAGVSGGREETPGKNCAGWGKPEKTKLLTWERQTFSLGKKCETILFTNCFLVYFNKSQG